MECQDRSTMYFNPRSHEGSDKILHILHNIISIFQSTLPRRERPRLRRMPLVMYNFNPRSHEGSDDQDLRQNNYSKISIHAPTKGATVDQDKADYSCHISIHAPTKGATDTSCRIADASQYFNPRSHEGSDRINIILPLGTIISIHAPTKGATHLSA